MGATHRLDFSLTIDSAEPGLEGTPIEIGSVVTGSISYDASVMDENVSVTLGDYFDSALSGFITCDNGDGPIAEIVLGPGDTIVNSELIPFIPDGFNTTFALNQGGILGDLGFGSFDVGGVGLSFFDDDGLALESDSLAEALGSGLVGFDASNGGTQFLSITLQDGRDFYQATGGLESFSISVIPAPGSLAIAALAAAMIFGKRLKRA